MAGRRGPPRPSTSRAAGRRDLSLTALHALLSSPGCQGADSLHLVSRDPFWDEADLPFTVHGGGNVLRIVPRPGFTRDNLAGSLDERLLVADCPDDEGWLVPAGVVSAWMSRHVACPELDDLLLAHPLFAYVTKLDGKGHSRMGRGRLVHWAPGIPTAASLVEPPFLPEDPAAPAVNRDHLAYADAVVDLVRQLRAAFDLDEVDVSVRLA